MGTYNLTDSFGRRQRIKAASMSQARIALCAINDSNAKLPDGGKALADSWRKGSAATSCIEGGAT